MQGRTAVTERRNEEAAVRGAMSQRVLKVKSGAGASARDWRKQTNRCCAGGSAHFNSPPFQLVLRRGISYTLGQRFVDTDYYKHTKNNPENHQKICSYRSKSR
ncbi:hypothetical protein CEXT_516771 [Caerostris extrusa]|uniref:Uncharacterized protein n=1 Tax=Caerostris extrusa TaxID=172846 RepID=A0AAV4V0B9_CAEEX|nr:hypothetical protein CEXT_516771 [Caerostris extrusa]